MVAAEVPPSRLSHMLEPTKIPGVSNLPSCEPRAQLGRDPRQGEVVVTAMRGGRKPDSRVKSIALSRARRPAFFQCCEEHLEPQDAADAGDGSEPVVGM